MGHGAAANTIEFCTPCSDRLKHPNHGAAGTFGSFGGTCILQRRIHRTEHEPGDGLMKRAARIRTLRLASTACAIAAVLSFTVFVASADLGLSGRTPKLWLATSLVLVAIAVAFQIAYRQERRRRSGRSRPCVNCGYDLRGNRSGTCPECGGLAHFRRSRR